MSSRYAMPLSSMPLRYVKPLRCQWVACAYGLKKFSSAFSLHQYLLGNSLVSTTVGNGCWGWMTLGNTEGTGRTKEDVGKSDFLSIPDRYWALMASVVMQASRGEDGEVGLTSDAFGVFLALAEAFALLTCSFGVGIHVML